MGDNESEHGAPGAGVLVRDWAAARAAAGLGSERVEASTLADVLDEIHRRRGASGRFADVLGMCAILVGETPVGARDPGDVVLNPDDTIEFLPPFAGG